MSILLFIINSIALGIGLAMDAFSVSITNGLREPKMKIGRMCIIAGCYAVFQFLMPMAGWFLVHTAAEKFEVFQKFIPWISLILLLYIGGKMLIEGIRARHDDSEEKDLGELTYGILFIQGVATSIDALSVGFTIASYHTLQAVGSSLIIGAVTFVICMIGIRFGKLFGEKFSDRATIAGGIILILIGIEIFVTGIF